MTPRDWGPNFRLGESCKIKHGFAFKGDWMISDNDQHLPIVVNIGNFKYDGGFRFETTPIQRYTGEIPEDYILTPGDILVVMTCQTPGGEILGIPGRIPDSDQVYLHNQRLGLAQITDHNKLDSGFLYHLFTSSDFNKHLYVTASGTKVKHTAPVRIEAYEFSLPPLPEQRKIAAILSTWDEAITLTERLIAALQERKRGLMQRLLTGEVRFPEFEGEWRETNLGEFFRPVSERNKNGDDLTVLSCSKIYGIVPQTQVFDKRVASANTNNYKIVKRGDLVIDPNLLWDASLDFLEEVEQGVVSPAYTVLRFKQRSRAIRKYFKYLLKTHYYREHYKFISQGTNVRRRKAPTDAFLGLEVWLGEPEEQTKITEVLRDCDQQLDQLQMYTDHLKTQKKGLMQRLLTGQVRVQVD